MNCCSTGLAVSNVVLVHAPAPTLWDVVTDIEAYPNFVEAMERTTIQQPLHSQASSEKNNVTGVIKTRVQVGTIVYEERCNKRRNDGRPLQVCKMRRIVTKVMESPSTNEYSISFSSQLDEVLPSSVDWLCYTCTLSILPATTPEAVSAASVHNDCCTLVGSIALEVGGAGSTSLSTCCPILSIACCRRQLKARAERHFDEELGNYATEAERRYQQEQPQKLKITFPNSQE